MLPRPASQAYICFQCQLRLLKVLKGPSHSSYFSTTASTAWNYQREQIRAKREAKAKKAESDNPPFESEYANPPFKRVDGLGQKEHLLSECHRFGEDVRSSGLKAPSTSPDVIVLREPKWRNPPPDSFAPDLKSLGDDIDIMAVVESERGTIGQPEVDTYIEELRPKDPNLPLSDEDFKRIWQTLEEGFTTQQLHRYARAYVEEQAGKQWAKRQEAIAKSEAVRYKTDWFPDQTKENFPFYENPLRGYSSISHNTKQQAVLSILRSCWNIHVKDVLKSTGELEMHLRNSHFRCLVEPSISPLEPIMAKLRHDDGELIQAFLSRSVLRITASRSRAYKIAEDIERDVLRRIRVLRIPLTMLKNFRAKALAKRRMKGHKDIEGTRSGFDEKLLKEIEKMTGTTISSDAESAYIWSINDNRGSTYASPAQVARRLIISYYTDSHKELPLMGLRPTDSPEALVKCEDLDSLSWYDRLRQWVRRTSATTKSTENKSKLLLNAQGTFKKNGSENISLAYYKASPPLVDSVSRTGRMLLPEKGPQRIGRKEKERERTSSKIWKSPYSSSYVILGQVLHERANALPVEIITGTSDVLFSKHQVFSTTVPNLAGLIESMRASNPDIESTVTESVEMRFEPSPLSASIVGGAKKFQSWRAFPNVQMKFGIDEVDPRTRNLYFKDILAIADTSTTDVMLPDRPVDLRFQRRKTYRGRRVKLIASHNTPLAKFLSASQLNLIDGIKTPPGLSIPMDRAMCTNLNAWTPQPENDVMNVEYLFAGMDIKKKMQFDFNGWTLIYTDITSGKAGGRQREIRLRPTPTQSREVDEEDFIKAAFQLTNVVGQVRAEDAAVTADMSNIIWQFQGARKEYLNSPDYYIKRLVLDGGVNVVEEKESEKGREVKSEVEGEREGEVDAEEKKEFEGDVEGEIEGKGEVEREVEVKEGIEEEGEGERKVEENS